MCTDTTTGGSASDPTKVICLHGVNVACNETDAKCGTDLVCDDEATDSNRAETTGKCKIDYNKKCTVGEADTVDKCATGLVCQLNAATPAAPVCHREAGETCNTGTTGTD